MGHNPKRKLESIPEMLSSEITVSLLTTGSPRICSHQQFDIIAKEKNHTHNNQTSNRVS